MSFTIRLTQDLISSEAGATVPLSIEIENKGKADDRYEMQVEGLDPEWTASPEPVFTVGTKETHSQKVFFKPPRSTESLAGNYPFVVRVRSLESGDARTVQGVLQIKPFHHLSMELSPKKGYMSPMRHQNTFGVTIMNLGNAEHTLQLSGGDPEEACTYEFEQDQVTVGPGQQKIVEVTVNPGRPSLVATSQLFGFSINARSIQNPNILSSAQGQLEQRPLISFGALTAVVILLGVLTLWYAFRPQPPTARLTVSNSSPFRGETITIRWHATNAQSVTLQLKHTRGGVIQPETVTDLPLDSSKDIVVSDEDTITVLATAVGETKQQASNLLLITPQTPPTPNPPQIVKFKADKRQYKLGEPVLLSFTFSPDVTKAILSPTNQEISPATSSLQVIPARTGEIIYELTAFNAKNGFAKQQVKVSVYQASLASIVSFSAEPNSIQLPDTRTIVRWQVTGSVSVKWDDGTGNVKEVDPSNPGIDVMTDHNLTMKLTAIDAQGVPISKQLKIKVKPLVPPPTTGGDPSVATTGGATTGGATTGTTTGGR